MARRPLKRASMTRTGWEHPLAKVTRVPIAESRRLVTIGPQHPAWTDPDELPNVALALVRWLPPAWVTAQQLEDLQLEARNRGAKGGAVYAAQPGPQTGTTPALQAALQAAQAPPGPDHGNPGFHAGAIARHVVQALVERARTEDRQALAAVVETCFSEVGL